jgi:hypothetical protein
VHLVHAIFAIPLHAHTAPISSTSQVLCVIIIVTLRLLWQFNHAFGITGCYAEIPQPLRQLRLFIFSGGLRLFVFSVTVELTFSISVTGLNAHQLSIASTNIFIPLRDSSPPLSVIPTISHFMIFDTMLR